MMDSGLRSRILLWRVRRTPTIMAAAGVPPVAASSVPVNHVKWAACSTTCFILKKVFSSKLLEQGLVELDQRDAALVLHNAVRDSVPSSAASTLASLRTRWKRYTSWAAQFDQSSQPHQVSARESHDVPG